MGSLLENMSRIELSSVRRMLSSYIDIVGNDSCMKLSLGTLRMSETLELVCNVLV